MLIAYCGVAAVSKFYMKFIDAEHKMSKILYFMNSLNFNACFDVFE